VVDPEVAPVGGDRPSTQAECLGGGDVRHPVEGDEPAEQLDASPVGRGEEAEHRYDVDRLIGRAPQLRGDAMKAARGERLTRTTRIASHEGGSSRRCLDPSTPAR
jgi:hypothetical protein